MSGIRFLGADLELVTCNGDDKHPEEDRLHGEEDTVQDPGLLQPDVLGRNRKWNYSLPGS